MAKPAIGIIIMRNFPRAIWDEGNPSTFDFPVKLKMLDMTYENLVFKPDEALLTSLITATKELEKDGARAVTTTCGFMSIFQKQIQASVHIPVFTSSLLQVPLVYQITGRKVGIVTADSRGLSLKHLMSVGIENSIPVAIAGLER